MNWCRAIAADLLACAVLIGGCAQDADVVPPPAYAPMGDAESLRVIAQRQEQIHSVTVECDLELTDARGERVNLDGVLVAEPPGRVRLRAWKMGQAVFDLTLDGGHGWVLLPESGPAAGKFDPEKLPARRVGGALDLMGPDYFRAARIVERTPGTLVAVAHLESMGEVVCEIDRSTLTPRRFLHAGASSGAAPALELDRFSLVVPDPPLVYPLMMRFTSADGTVVVRARSVELNGEVPEGAFTAPRRARPLP